MKSCNEKLNSFSIMGLTITRYGSHTIISYVCSLQFMSFRIEYDFSNLRVLHPIFRFYNFKPNHLDTKYIFVLFRSKKIGNFNFWLILIHRYWLTRHFVEKLIIDACGLKIFWDATTTTTTTKHNLKKNIFIKMFSYLRGCL